MDSAGRFNPFVGYFKERFGCRLQKLVVDAGFTCPNRDGTLSRGGCTFCDNNAFHPNYSTPDKSISQQLAEGVEFHRVRYSRASKYLAYFQSYTNTYAPVSRLRELYEEALAFPDVVGLAIGTRPDCLGNEVLDYLAEIRSRGKVVFLEIGIESCYDSTLDHINRKHTFARAEEAVGEAAARGLLTGGHFIFGLPGESEEMMLAAAGKINSLPLDSVKFHQLQIIRGTRIEQEFADHPERFVTWSLEGYIDFFIDFLTRLRPDLRIERFAGEVPPRFVSSTPWGLVRYAQMVQMLERRLEERDERQGSRYVAPRV